MRLHFSRRWVHPPIDCWAREWWVNLPAAWGRHDSNAPSPAEPPTLRLSLRGASWENCCRAALATKRKEKARRKQTEFNVPDILLVPFRVFLWPSYQCSWCNPCFSTALLGSGFFGDYYSNSLTSTARGHLNLKHAPRSCPGDSSVMLPP